MMLKMIKRKLGTCVDVKQFMLLKLNFCRSSNGVFVRRWSGVRVSSNSLDLLSATQ